jgi:hypothetical protein
LHLSANAAWSIRPRADWQHLAGQAARRDQDIAPQLARFQIALVAGVVAEREEDGEADAQQRERRGIQMDVGAEQAPVIIQRPG